MPKVYGDFDIWRTSFNSALSIGIILLRPEFGPLPMPPLSG